MEKKLSRSKNEENLAAYSTNFILETAGNPLGTHETIFIYIMKGRAVELPKMSIRTSVRCNVARKRDTRIVLHASVAANEEAEIIVISSPDTDVLVLLLHHRSKIVAKEIFFLNGRMGTHVDMKRYYTCSHYIQLSNIGTMFLTANCILPEWMQHMQRFLWDW